ncbi:hypothetical protein BDQ17DRAFT_1234445 [Cyathus striatus]|nr:hypothetical protein BDQ17DRAFT_1234445 [Cyathus striatus]
MLLFSYATIILIPLISCTSPKAGLGWSSGNKIDIAQYASKKVSWYYTWTPIPIYEYNLEFVPMIRGNDYVAQYAGAIEKGIKRKKVKAVLGMNEPDVKGQANTSAADAVALWKQYFQPLKARHKHIRLGSPAPFNSAQGKVWLQDFFRICNGSCTVDFLALHWFGTNATCFIAHLKDYHQTFNKPIWVTEWACQNCKNSSGQSSKAEIVKFLNETQTFLDNADFVERYAWYGAMSDLKGMNQCNALMGREGKINDLGKQYIGMFSLAPDFGSGTEILFQEVTLSYQDTHLP